MASQVGRSTSAPGAAQIAKATVAFLIGGMAVHFVVMFLDYFLVIKPLFLDLQTNFTDIVFSTMMFPMITAYGLLASSIYLLWEKKKKALLLAREANIQKEKVDAVLKSMQGITGLLAEHIALQNSEVLSWIELKNRKGQTVPAKIEKPSKQIAKALQALSETSFVVPFSECPPANIGELVDILKGKLTQVDTDLRCRPPAGREREQPAAQSVLVEDIR
jgi:hypothetical protein